MTINKLFGISNNNYIRNKFHKNTNYSDKLSAMNNQFNPLEYDFSRGLGLNEISFKAGFNESDLIKKRATNNKHIILDSLSGIFESDKNLINDAFWGEVTDESKFSKASWYIKLKNESSNNYVFENLNIRKFIKLYNEFYKNHLSSAYLVAHNKKTYIDKDKTDQIISHFEKNGNLDKYIEESLDNYFEDCIRSNNDKSKNASTSLFEKEKNKLYKTFNTNPLLMKSEDLKEFLKIIDEVLEVSDDKTYNEIISGLIELSFALKNNRKDAMINSFREIKDITLPIWEREILTEKITNNEINLGLINDFKHSYYYESINHDKKMGQIFELPFFSPDEKVFLIKHIKNDMETLSPTSRTFLEFLKNTVIEDDKRKMIVQRVMTDMEIANENFPFFKSEFIKDVRNKDESSVLLQKKIGDDTVLELILDKVELDERHPLLILDELTDEDLNKLLDEIRPSWLDEKYKESCKREESKYDIADNFENILNKLTIDNDGKQISINEFVEKAFSDVYGNLDILKQRSDKVIEDIMTNRSILINHDNMSKFAYTATMQQLLKMTEMLQEQNSSSEKLYTEISKVLDKLETIAPNRKKEIQYTRSTLEKIKDGICKKQNIIPAAFALQSGKSLVASLASGTILSSVNLLPAMLLFMYGSMLYENLRREFSKE